MYRYMQFLLYSRALDVLIYTPLISNLLEQLGQVIFSIQVLFYKVYILCNWVSHQSFNTLLNILVFVDDLMDYRDNW